MALWSDPLGSSSGSFVTSLSSFVLQGEGFGKSACTTYEVCDVAQRGEAPYLFVWLHGADGGGGIPEKDMQTMQRRLGRRTVFFVPMNPSAASDGLRFFWGVSYTKKQNKNALGFVFGEFHQEYLDALTGAVRQAKLEVNASRVLVGGYSMGGFGAYQLGSHAPDLFHAVISAAGYGLGTLEPPNAGFGAPQPESSDIFQAFLDQHVPRLAQVPGVFVVHSPADSISSFNDAAAIVGALQAHGGNAELLIVSEDAANTDPNRKKKQKLGHSYFNYALLHDTSEVLLYAQLRRVLEEERSEAQCRVLPPPFEMSAFPSEPMPQPFFRVEGGRTLGLSEQTAEEASLNWGTVIDLENTPPVVPRGSIRAALGTAWSNAPAVPGSARPPEPAGSPTGARRAGTPARSNALAVLGSARPPEPAGSPTGARRAGPPRGSVGLASATLARETSRSPRGSVNWAPPTALTASDSN
ncbi:unnamed protein product [Polarella glacialis]|uniref:Peptidase S9 prolyl oligopeptidase catalytic domain-containing protein n=1 Tax=Polarella glacialis TaxID=89957 RepID=A0A813GSI8_POLGL|nr:unnamed protein product [Polarella glacialis]CAE8698167.1 unnamed protein product [Polarella glacialis]